MEKSGENGRDISVLTLVFSSLSLHSSLSSLIPLFFLFLHSSLSSPSTLITHTSSLTTHLASLISLCSHHSSATCLSTIFLLAIVPTLYHILKLKKREKRIIHSYLISPYFSLKICFQSLFLDSLSSPGCSKIAENLIK